ncbi:formin-like protein 13 isoform X2 [Tanacetum coccineum]
MKLIFSDLDTTAFKPAAELTCFDEWLGPKRDLILKVSHKIATPDIVQETPAIGSSQSVQSNNLYNVAPDLNKQKLSDVVKNKLQPKSALSSHSSNTSAEQADAKLKSRAAVANKPEKVQLIDHRRAYNWEFMLLKVKLPLNELMLMKVPRTESKLKVFSFKMQFNAQVSDLTKNLNIVNSAVEQASYLSPTMSSGKLETVMQTILSLGNALNQGTARGSAVGFRLDRLLKLTTKIRGKNNGMTLMHYLCKVLADKIPEVLDFSKDLSSLEPAAKIQLKYLAEEMQAISKGLKKVSEELSMAENDRPVSENFLKVLKEFLHSAQGEVRSLVSLYCVVGRNMDSLSLYFGEDPVRCPYEQVVSTLLKFVSMFNQANEENAKQLEAEKKKAKREALNES